ncbi:MAG: tetratricopeptide repeat protein [Cyanomargarita calcarea GSE-NOS-MK-12-04C]|jgi:Tfp pilus assembly protein PilF|uniref:Tetratricopeptide repeat protein n=1 Tax=Cyanomargarita calcarea GSE-NOS-MK-12-04C TaxID=2839659 RepID=A0A951QVJ4_9CYAN|nr:tetratricopeptide repeat protein [Cyanomargarita calcarea GSE-NOS-MK-12-04C]
MSTVPNFSNCYQVGGSLPFTATTYVLRQADEELYAGLKTGSFCYVLNSRQMGKSSLRVRTMRRLETEGFACCAIEMRDICGYGVTPDEFFGGFLSLIVSGFDLSIDVGEWWYKYAYISPLMRLNKFIEEELLETIVKNIVIFVDEIDNVLNLEFKDDFFAFIRGCYNKRADNDKYNRLTFALLGVATPADLITDTNLTAFNIDSQAVELAGLEFQQATPLEQGFVGIVRNTKAVLQEVLNWTGGQPFLTQCLCQLVCIYPSMLVHPNCEAEWVAKIVKERIIDNWWTQDKQQHLQTIRERLLSNESRSCRLLGLYQQILQQREITADDSREQMELRLSGLVVKQQGKLRVYNRIYESVFNCNWVEKQLENLRPYSESFHAWVIANFQDESRLLRGQALQEALTWAETKSLSDLDYQFLAASQELDKQHIQVALQVAQQANQILAKAQTKARKLVRIGFVTMSASILIGVATVPLVLTWLPPFLQKLAYESYYNGLATSDESHMKSALRKLNWALMVRPGYPEAHYTRGLVYEFQNDFNNARFDYEAATLRKLPQAYNSLARLNILDKNYPQAVEQLSQALKLTSNPRLKLIMLKNLGWAKLEQKQYIDAEKFLRESIAIENRQGSAHCLLAQLMEKSGVNKNAIVEWKKCLDFSAPFHPDEKGWVVLAKQRLKKKGEK